MTPLVTPRLFFAFEGVFSVFLCDGIFKFRMQSAFQMNLLSFSIAFIRRYTEMDLQTKFLLFVKYGRYNKPVRKRLTANFMIPF